MPWVGIEGKSSAELRENFMKLHVIPMARRAFGADPELGSILIVVGQFWCDEAEDAVHVEFVPAATPAPQWPACLDDERFFHEEDGWTELNDRAEALVGYAARRELPMLDANSTAITAFGAYCLEGCDQEMPMKESHTPYAIIRRGGDAGPEIETVGTTIQPQWEDRFDVGYADAKAGTINTNPLVEKIPDISAVGRWVKRLFGKE